MKSKVVDGIWITDVWNIDELRFGNIKLYIKYNLHRSNKYKHKLFFLKIRKFILL